MTRFTGRPQHWAGRWALSAGSGLLGTLAFPRWGWWPLAMVSVAGLSIAVRDCRGRRAAGYGAVYAAGLFGPMLHWTSIYVGAFPWLLLVLSQLAYVAAMAAALPRIQRGRFGAVLTAGAWVVEEAVRDRWPFGGFPWGRWAFSQSASPLRWFAALGGAPLVTFVVALIGALLAQSALSASPAQSADPALTALPALSAPPAQLADPALTALPALSAPPAQSSHFRRAGRRVLALAVAVGLLLAGWGLAPVLRSKPGRYVTVAAVQGNVPDRGLEFNARRRQVLDNHVAATLQLAARIKAGQAPQPDFVLWPENASDIDPTTNADAAAVIQQATDAVGVPILVGALLDGPGNDHVTNAGIVWQPSSSAAPGPGQRYVKRHPVPFGEYIPARTIARALSSKVDLVARDMIAGSGDGRLTVAGVDIGDVICFEVAYDGLVQSSVAKGAQLIVVQTNNATFGHTAETYQQLAMSRLRAVEHARTVVQVATSGKSAIIEPDGSIAAESGALFTSAIMDQQVSLSTGRTVATRLGGWVELTLVALTTIGVAAGYRSQPTVARIPEMTGRGRR